MRLDAYLFEKGYYDSRNKAAEAIKRGQVMVGGKTVTKTAYSVEDGALVTIIGQSYVSVGAYKLLKAVNEFKLDIKGKIFVDVGASTGGFTQVLINSGAKKVYAVDVGKDLLDRTLAAKEEVVKMDGVNARYLKKSDFPDEIDGAVVDCSFISLKLILPTVAKIVKSEGDIVALIKPQFECGQKSLPKSGVLIDKKAHFAVLQDLYEYVLSQGLSVKDFTYSPLNDRKNVEYLIYLKLNGESIPLEMVLSTAREAIS